MHILIIFAYMKFLDAIAARYADRYSDLHKFLFVFPNKRSCIFFREALARAAAGRELRLPRTESVSEFITALSGRRSAPKTELLFMLYDAYRRMAGHDVDFDRFRSWGEVVIGDYSDVDMYGANPDKLFKNVRDWREIKTDYLTDEQRGVMREYFGMESEAAETTSRFWEHYQPVEGAEGYATKNRFMHLWESLAPLYHEFGRRLQEENCAYTGMSYRLAYERLKENPEKALKGRRIVFVGFNVLPSMQFRIFALLRDTKSTEPAGALRHEYASEANRAIPMADFYWDCTGPALEDRNNSATYFIHRNIRTFPSRFDISDSDVSTFPEEMEVVASPSNTVQTKLAGSHVASLIEKFGPEAAEQTAIILPDEHLLTPLLYSLPESVPDRNITMGFPLRLSLSASFLGLIRKLQLRSRERTGNSSFFFEDVRGIISHPFAKVMAGPDEIDRIEECITTQRLYMMPADVLTSGAPSLACIFTRLSPDDSAQRAHDYIDSVLTAASVAVGTIDSTQASAEVSHSDEISNISDGLLKSAAKYGVEMSSRTFLQLLERAVSNTSMSLQGEPLEGLQIMGTLETRCLDFRHVVILSLNERVFPRRMQLKSFIPAALRSGFGLPTNQFRECVFSYYFYRMISRADTVYMTYDARAAGLKSADPSRYLQQLRYLYPKSRLKWGDRRFKVIASELPELTVAKTGFVADELEKFAESESNAILSASALERYMDCPMKFYLQTVHRLREVIDPNEFITALNFGNVFHHTLQYIYSGPDGGGLTEGRRISAEWLDTLLRDKGAITSIISRLVIKELRNSDRERPDAEELFYTDLIEQYVRKTLRADREMAAAHGSFTYLGSEVTRNIVYTTASGRRCNFRFAIDRVDSIIPGTVRLSDYKTGAATFNIDSIDDAFNPDKKAAVVFQLMLYAKLFRQCYPSFTGPVALSVYNMQSVAYSYDSSKITIGGEPLEDFATVEADFTRRLDALIEDIFHTGKPFVQAPEGSTACSRCSFQRICVR